jgi:hypothetical protein
MLLSTFFFCTGFRLANSSRKADNLFSPFYWSGYRQTKYSVIRTKAQALL